MTERTPSEKRSAIGTLGVQIIWFGVALWLGVSFIPFFIILVGILLFVPMVIE